MLKLLKNLGKKEWITICACLLLIVGQVWLELKMPDYMSEITQLVQTEGSEMSEIVENGVYMLACALRKFDFCSNYRISCIRCFGNIFKKSKKKVVYQN